MAKTIKGVCTYSQAFSRLVTGEFSGKNKQQLLPFRIKDKGNYNGMKRQLQQLSIET